MCRHIEENESSISLTGSDDSFGLEALEVPEDSGLARRVVFQMEKYKEVWGYLLSCSSRQAASELEEGEWELVQTQAGARTPGSYHRKAFHSPQVQMYTKNNEGNTGKKTGSPRSLALSL